MNTRTSFFVSLIFCAGLVSAVAAGESDLPPVHYPMTGTPETAIAGDARLPARDMPPEWAAVASADTHVGMFFSKDVPGTVIVDDRGVVNGENASSFRVGPARDNIPALVVDGNNLSPVPSVTLEGFFKIDPEDAKPWLRLAYVKRQQNSFTWLMQLDGDAKSLRARFDVDPVDQPQGSGHNRSLRADVVVADGQWHHLALTMDGATRKATLYMDYDEVASFVLQGPLVHEGGDMVFMDGVAGWVDELRLSPWARSPGEMLKVQK